MPTSLFQYEMLPTTWFYVSSLMILATFFRFNRFLSVRNLDIVGVIMFAPGLLCLSMGTSPSDSMTQIGYLWLAVVGFLAFLRMVLDSFMVRRPLLEPNLTPSSLTFACITLMTFTVANIVVNRGDKVESASVLRLEQILTMQSEANGTASTRFLSRPGYQPFLSLTEATNRFLAPAALFRDHFSLRSGAPNNSKFNAASTYNATDYSDSSEQNQMSFGTSRKVTFEGVVLLVCIALIQLGILLGMIFIGHCHFGNIKTGIAAAMFYLLLPYVTQMTGTLDHFLPGLLIVSAVLIYRRPLFSGVLIGMAGVLVFYPFFLLPLWASFYYRRGLFRFLLGAFSAVLAMSIALLSSPESLGSYPEQLALLFGHHSLRVPYYDGLWSFCPTIYRIPIVAFFGVFCFGLLLWPARKNLATLISCSAIVMLGVQFWIGNQGGLYMAWYLPLLILTIFRPNLEDRVATATVTEVSAGGNG